MTAHRKRRRRLLATARQRTSDQIQKLRWRALAAAPGRSRELNTAFDQALELLDAERNLAVPMGGAQ